MRRLDVQFVVLALLLVACDRAEHEDPIVHGTRAPSASTTTIAADVSALWWDASQNRLVVVDETHDTLLAVSDGITAIAKLPTSRTLGSVVGLSDGRFLVASNGYGTDGAVFAVTGDKVTAIANLDPARRRTSLAAAPDGAIYVGYTMTSAKGTSAGIALLDVARGEEKVLVESGFVGPAGIAVTSSALFVSDPLRGALVTLARRDPASPSDVTTELPDPGAVLALPSNDILVASRAGVVIRVTPAGGPIVVANGFEQVRAIAYDPAGKRLFVADHHALGGTELHEVVLE